jgi:HD superfamily phosphohydrolase
MLSAGIRQMIEDGASAASIKAMDDIQLFTAMDHAGGYAAEMADRIRRRRLFKRTIYVGLECLDPSLIRTSERIVAQELAADAGVDPSYILVDNPPLPDNAMGNFPALVGTQVQHLRDVSPLVSILERAHKATWRFGIYAPSELRERVAQAAKRFLNLKKSTVQHTFSDIDNSYL